MNEITVLFDDGSEMNLNDFNKYVNEHPEETFHVLIEKVEINA